MVVSDSESDTMMVANSSYADATISSGSDSSASTRPLLRLRRVSASAPVSSAVAEDPAVLLTRTITSLANWPNFPSRYVQKLGEAHIRWGGTRSKTYEVQEMHIDPEEMVNWARPRCAAWLDARGLSSIVRYISHGEMPYGGCRAVQFIKYDYCAPPGMPGLYPCASQHETVYHGTYCQ